MRQTISVFELAERLGKQFDEVTLVELLEITSEDLVTVFMDRIEENMDYLLSELEELPIEEEEFYNAI